MATINWAVMCETAFPDELGRLSIVRIVRTLAAPALPFELHQQTLVAHLKDIEPTEGIEMVVLVVAPNESLVTPQSTDCAVIEMSGEYVLVTLRDLPIRHEGVYRFGIALRDQPAVFVDVPVVVAQRPEWAAGVH
jgi:hypothetical protein